MAKTIIGTVSSIAGNKTVVITTHWRKTHPVYKKQYTVSAKYMAHDEENVCKLGDKIVIKESRPLSARKRYAVKEILEHAALTDEDRKVIDAETTIPKKADKMEVTEPKETVKKPAAIKKKSEGDKE